MLDDEDDDAGPEKAQLVFFAALLSGDASALDEVLAEGFLMIDGFRDGAIARTQFLGDVKDGRLRFDALRAIESRLRRWGDVAVFTGRTEGRRRFGVVAWNVRTRFTHVYVVERGRFRLASAHDHGIMR
jgi:hypothetical protein